MAGVLYVAVVSRVLDLADAAFRRLPSFARGSRRRSIYTPKDDANVGVYATGSTSRHATATPFGRVDTATPRVTKRYTGTKISL
ncbi:hypothetical protein PF005_g6256 [Phytophthora fragariae]|uniref:Uncharacterized protein n=1 Tax=Phytophthora fragariae TaxID=53985 RepID=A0A6A3SWU5_9STRA|nr:hypothetical protein PF003_g992 [Phytophthora fragariae]KAE8943351.1 hypothetical protein PF009_g6927 [Phytophthora fragariae]KAE9020765.1 hypothetical protein PF011_g5254 [Phytophthora fragariae]KAE9125362.1 hypothetical protein PF007_g6376 [Phytophthora fragariae]KAE9126023.1 hypothetical protein PF010_g5412 [Phytophthora fragariae]